MSLQVLAPDIQRVIAFRFHVRLADVGLDELWNRTIRAYILNGC